MKQRDDIKGGIAAPLELQEAALRFGGKNSYGEPMYRLVLADSVHVKEGGRWFDWDESVPIAERGGLVCSMTKDGEFQGVHTVHRPIRVVDEIREVPKYPHMKGWVLERWLPAYMFGSQRAWYAAQATAEELTEDQFGRPYMKTVPLNLPILGPYPERGDYRLASEPMDTTPSITGIQEAIAAAEALRTQYMASTQGQVDQRIYEAQYRQRKREEKEREETNYRIRDLLSPLAGTSLTAGAYRTKLAERAGIYTHEGN